VDVRQKAAAVTGVIAVAFAVALMLGGSVPLGIGVALSGLIGFSAVFDRGGGGHMAPGVSRGHFVAAAIVSVIALGFLAVAVAVIIDAWDRPVALAAFWFALAATLAYLALRAFRLGRAARARERSESEPPAD
jgi:hypothetical protein